MKKISRQTKIIATIGPATESEEMLAKLINEGVDVIRLNMAHADHDWIRIISKRIRSVGQELNREPAIMMDVKGPEIRTGYLHEELEIKKDDLLDLVFIAQPNPPTADGIWQIEVNYDKLSEHIKEGDTVMVDNGLIQLEVLDSSAERIRCQVQQDSILKSRRHVNLPGIETGLPSLTEKDRRDSLVGIECMHDYFALSFTRDADSVDLFRSFLRDNGSDAQIIAKLEDHKGVNNLQEIIQSADALMVARGDLGIECAFEDLPIIQRKAVGACLAAGKPVIVATHMLESMIESPVPTRAEISDVANAVNEGADCIMLSGETTTGKYPIECVKMLTRIASRMEEEIQPGLTKELKLFRPKAKMLRSAAMLAMRLDNAAVLVFTRSGDLAAKLGALRPNGAPLFAFTDVKGLHRRLRLIWGIEPFLMNFYQDPELTIQSAIKRLKEGDWIKEGDQLVTVTNAFAHSKIVESIQIREVEF
ncbi:pyruvate kinase [Opitutales bacterium]|mgnify:CR=1 FL=1|nr:pyruvate kinase [Opitutales bacterium]